MFSSELRQHLRHNFTVNVMDGAFFGLGLGFASSVTVIPLFVNTLTDSTALIGLIASIQMIGWQLPQILTAGYVARLRRYLPMVMWMTFHERWPFFALAVVAFFLGYMSSTVALILTFFFLTWFAFGGGFTATAWQSLIGKIMPVHRRGTFWGTQAAAASIMTAGAGALAGVILTQVAYPYNFALCFALAGTTMMISMGFLGWTKEPAREVPSPAAPPEENTLRSFSSRFEHMLWEDANLRMFLVARILSQFGWMAVAFYTIYGVQRFQMNEATAGILLAVFMIIETIANPLVGWLGDKWGHRRLFAIGGLAIALSAFVALMGTSFGWLYLAFGLAGIAKTTIWTSAMTMTLEFGTEEDRPYYIGLTNTLTAPGTILAPLIGGWLADAAGFGVTFGLATVAGLGTALVLLFIVRDPATRSKAPVASAPVVGS